MGIPFYPSLFSPSEEEDTDARWEETKGLLQTNPQLLTVELLLSILKQQAPVHVVEFFLLSSQPTLDLMPKVGPTPLQLAAAEGCCPNVVQLLIRACPWALCVTSVAEPEDPLSLAKKFGQEDLVKLLERPLVEWLEESSLLSSPLKQTTLLQGSSTILQQQQQQEQQEDLANVKLLCARLLKRNQQLSKEIKLCQQQQVMSMGVVIPKLSSQQTMTTATREQNMNDSDKATNTRIAELEIRLDKEATLHEMVRNDLKECKQGMTTVMMMIKQHQQQQYMWKQQTAQSQKKEEESIFQDDENSPPPTSDSNKKKQQHESQRLTNRPRRKSVCRPFNSVMLK
ncbi:unnamed protein product [Cylindrotheca closterium]|uniref:Uncharacterized protein n=1 Tax=Cylindrotheca closterium TaxID=2856 RepID=A0AAD2G5Y5_9STRA|nr:unnamed protein product [Cylindrotheca closterium]